MKRTTHPRTTRTRQGKAASAVAVGAATAMLLVGCSKTNKSIDTTPAAAATTPPVTAPVAAAPAATEPVATTPAVVATETQVAATAAPAIETVAAAPDPVVTALPVADTAAAAQVAAAPETAAAVVDAAVAQVSAANSGTATASATNSGNASVDVNAIPKLKNEVGALRDATVKSCSKDGTGWKADGVVNNAGKAPASYVITVSFLDDKNTTMGLNWSKVDKVAAGAAADWSLTAPAAGEKLQCILRVTRGDA
jgi:hypothetical protein